MADDREEIIRVAEIDRLTSRGNVFRMRGDYLAAEDAYREALRMDESREDLRELVADMLYARGQVDKAAAEYKKIVENKPANASAETKYARAVLEIGEREHEKQIAQAMIENPSSFAPHEKRPIVAILLSALAPGVGQIYNGETIKGAIILGALIFSLLMLALSPQDVKNMLLTLKAFASPGSGYVPPVSSLAILFASVIVFDWIYAVIDAPISADKLRAKEKELGVRS